MTDTRRVMCERKVRHFSREDAEAALAKLKSARPIRESEKPGVYHCPHCHGFHVGRRAKKKRRKS